MEQKCWNGFVGGAWQNEINLRDFIQTNYKEYKGDASFLAGATKRTKDLMKRVEALFMLERQYGGVLEIDTATVSSLTSYSPGYIDKDEFKYENIAFKDFYLSENRKTEFDSVMKLSERSVL